MLTPDELRELPEDVVDIFKDCEDEILRKIGEKIAETGDLSKANVRKLKSLKNRTLMQEDLSKTLQKYSGKSKKELRKLFKEAGELSLLDDDKTVGEKHRSKKMNDLLRAISAQTEGTMQNMTRTTARNATNDFYKELDKAVLSVQSGSSTQEQAIKRCIDNLADKMDYVEYNGRRDTLEVAVRRAVRTGLNQLTAELTLLRCEEQGIEFVEVSAHAGARTSKTHDCTNHAWWQGKVYHIGKDWGYARRRAYPPLMAYHFAGYGYGEGLCGWNCRHSFRPYIPYVTKRRYTERDVQRLNKESVTYSGRKYTREQIDQIQRKYERQVRKYKRRAILAKSAGDQTEYARANAKVKEWENALKDLVKQTGGHRELGREYVVTTGEDNPYVPRSEAQMLDDVKRVIDTFKDNPNLTRSELTRMFDIRYEIGVNLHSGKPIYIRAKDLSYMIHKHVSDGSLSYRDFENVSKVIAEMPYSKGIISGEDLRYFYIYKCEEREGYYDAVIKPDSNGEELFHFNYKGISNGSAKRNKTKIDKQSVRLGADIEM